jgi:hypothetical protein
MRRNLAIAGALATLIVALGIGQGILEQRAAALQNSDGKVQVPRFEVDPTFPKPLPNHWYQGMSIGVGVDGNDHVWIVHRPDTVNANEAAADAKTGECCSKAPPILEFDHQGTLRRHWGDGDGGKMPGQFYAVHSIATDSKGNIYTTETYDGRRLQRFLYKGMQRVTKGEDQGTVWPKTNTQ